MANSPVKSTFPFDEPAVFLSTVMVASVSNIGIALSIQLLPVVM